MSKMGEHFTQQQEEERYGSNRADNISELLTISEMTLIIAGLEGMLNTHPMQTPDILAIRSVIWDARAAAEMNEYAGDHDYPDDHTPNEEEN